MHYDNHFLSILKKLCLDVSTVAISTESMTVFTDQFLMIPFLSLLQKTITLFVIEIPNTFCSLEDNIVLTCYYNVASFR